MAYSANLQKLVNCHACATVQESARKSCRFCGHALQQRKPHSLQRTWCYLLTGLLFYLPSNVLPIMTTVQLGIPTHSTIAGGVVVMWEDGSYLIALIILIASLLVPIAKFLALFALCLAEQFKIYRQPQHKLTLFRLTELVGRWSMVDVFVVAFLTSLIQLDNMLSVYPGPAALAFAGMVLFTMLAANSLDPKMFWDDYE